MLCEVENNEMKETMLVKIKILILAMRCSYLKKLTEVANYLIQDLLLNKLNFYLLIKEIRTDSKYINK